MVIDVCDQHLSVLCPTQSPFFYIPICVLLRIHNVIVYFLNKMDLENIAFMCSCNEPGWLVLLLVNYPAEESPVPPVTPTTSLISYCSPNSPEPKLPCGSWSFASDVFWTDGSA